ncbi:MAG TPA: 1-deoxy-D-xylulose-5-phosphate synthase, partial [Firmicutes bacterium]|nr:1-deoxy-D-xylulose-5-phosphate synthase [Bacillota bacterium]
MANLLSQINSPADLKDLSPEQLEVLAEEIRQYIVDVISNSSGHFAPSLGVVELTIALHRVYDTPRDRIVWDVGHQAYVHKILTGRRDRFPTIRKKDGLSGYLRRSESEYDAFGAGHASTSISAALGIATARDIIGADYKVAAIIGDGAMTGGMPWEALNNAGYAGTDMLVILNDNRMSISPNVGALPKYLNDMISNETYNRIKDDVWEMLGKMPSVGKILREHISRLDSAVKSLVVPGIVFEKLGIRYFGPVNGHNLSELIPILKDLRELKGPKLLH